MKKLNQGSRYIKTIIRFVDRLLLHKLAIPFFAIVFAYGLYPLARFSLSAPLAIVEALMFGLVFSWWSVGIRQHGWRFVVEKTIVWTVAAVKYCVYIPFEWLVVRTIQMLKLPFHLIMNPGKHIPKILLPLQLLLSICYAAALIYGVCFGIDLLLGGKQEYWFHWVIFGIPYGLPLYAVVFIVIMIAIMILFALIDHVMDTHIMPRLLKFVEKEQIKKKYSSFKI